MGFGSHGSPVHEAAGEWHGDYRHALGVYSGDVSRALGALGLILTSEKICRNSGYWVCEEEADGDPESL